MKYIKYCLYVGMLFGSYIQSNDISFITHVYIQNFTTIDFSIELQQLELLQKKMFLISSPLKSIEPCSSNLILTFDRMCPIGEHMYTIKLAHGTDAIMLSQKLISIDPQRISDLSISIDQSCWYTVNSPGSHHISYQKFAGHNIAIDYYVENKYLCEDIAYTFVEVSALPSKNNQL